VSVLPYLTAGWIMLAGIYGIVTSRDLIHAVVCLSVTQSGTYVLLLEPRPEHGDHRRFP
jgi:multicomponent Na+:H+ antiporter subunit C